MSFGSTTKMVPCPRCGEKKRCDQRTKKFRCPCGHEESMMALLGSFWCTGEIEKRTICFALDPDFYKDPDSVASL